MWVEALTLTASGIGTAFAISLTLWGLLELQGYILKKRFGGNGQPGHAGAQAGAAKPMDAATELRLRRVLQSAIDVHRLPR